MDEINNIIEQSKDFIKGKDSTGHDAYAFTQNNFKKTFYQKPDKLNPNVQEGEITLEESIQRFAYNYCLYLTYGVEEAPSTGTPHLQGCFVLREATTLNCIKKRTNNEIHVEKIRKPLIANIFYSQKQKDFIFTHCDPGYAAPISDYRKNKNIPLKTRKAAVNKYELAKKILEETGDVSQVPVDVLIKHPKGVDKIKNLRLSLSVVKDLRLGNMYADYHQNHFLWLHGATGTLKSYNAVHEVQAIKRWLKKYYESKNMKLPFEMLWDHPYIKDTNKWFQDYNFEKVLIIEEATPEFCKKNKGRFKRWTDQYAFPVEVKGDSIALVRPEFIIVTSNYSLEDCFGNPLEGMDYEKDYLPMKRRFHEVKFEEKKVLNWPSWKLLAIEYNQKRLVKEYDERYDDLLYNIEMLVDDYKGNDDYTDIEVTDPLVIAQYMNTFQVYTKLDEAWRLYSENEEVVKSRKIIDVMVKNPELNSKCWKDKFKSDIWKLTEKKEPPKCDFCDNYFCVDCGKLAESLGWFCPECVKNIYTLKPLPYIEDSDGVKCICNHCKRVVDKKFLIDGHCDECLMRIFKNYILDEGVLCYDYNLRNKLCFNCFEGRGIIYKDSEDEEDSIDDEIEEMSPKKKRKLEKDDEIKLRLFNSGYKVPYIETVLCVCDHGYLSINCNHEECDKVKCHVCNDDKNKCRCGRFVNGKRNRFIKQTFGVPVELDKQHYCLLADCLKNRLVYGFEYKDKLIKFYFSGEVLLKYINKLVLKDNVYIDNRKNSNK